MNQRELFIEINKAMILLTKEDDKLSSLFVDADTFVRGRLKKWWVKSEGNKNALTHKQNGNNKLEIVIKKESRKEWKFISLSYKELRINSLENLKEFSSSI